MMETTLIFSNNDSANKMADLINGAVLLYRGLTTDETGDLLNRIRVTVLADHLTAKVVVTPSELEALLPGVK